MTNRMPDNISDGPQPDDGQIIPSPDPDEMRDLVNTLEDIGRLSTQTDRLDELYTGLRKGCYLKPQA